MRYLSLLLILFVLFSCEDPQPAYKPNHHVEGLKGETMGTTFSVTYLDSLDRDLSIPVEVLLKDINMEVSTYIENSVISQFNSGDSVTVPNNLHFDRNYKQAKEIYKQTEGWFNPSVMPLVNYWGFGYKGKECPQSAWQLEKEREKGEERN